MVRGKKIERFAKCLAAVTVLIFFFASDFRECFSENAEEKNRIVPKPVAATRRFEQLSFGRCRKHSASLASLGQSDDAYEPRAAVFAFFAAHGLNQFAYAIGVRRVRPRITRSMHAWGSAESRYNQPRIVRHHKPLGKAAIVQGFADGIFPKRVCSFVKFWQGVKIRNQIEIERCSGGRGQRAIFAQLARI